MKGAEVYINARGDKHKATFFGNKFINEEGITFNSPFAFSKHVTKKYSTASAPSGWAAIYTVYNYKNNNLHISLGDLYDLWERNLL